MIGILLLASWLLAQATFLAYVALGGESLK